MRDFSEDLSEEALAALAQRAFTSASRGMLDEDGRLGLDPDRVEKDLARLVLALIEFVRQLLETQAVRRMERGALTPDEEERVGLTLMRAREKLVAVAAEFGLGEEDLTLDLGPLGRVV